MGTVDLAAAAVPTSGVREVRVRPPSRALVALGEGLTRLVRPSIRLAGRTWPAYGSCVSSGVVLGAGWAVALAAWRGMSPLLALVLMLAGLATALALAFATKAATGAERFTFHHYQLCVLGAGGALLGAFGLPVLAGLDLVAVALAVTLAVGRLGCLSAGCCHGHPAPWGVRYGDGHAADGFPGDLVGVGLWPVPLVESLAVALLAAAMSVLVLSGRGADGAAPGTALALHLAGYAALRFVLERLRGDRRPHLLGLSEAQWTALAALAAVTGLGAASLLPLGDIAVATGAFALVVLPSVSLVDARRQAGSFLSGVHATEIAGRLSGLARAVPRSAARAGQGPIEVATTSRGLRLSTGLLGASRLVSFSIADAPLPAPLAAGVARRLVASSGAGLEGQLVQGASGVWHLLVRASGARHEG